jgi:hypothetical protein
MSCVFHSGARAPEGVAFEVSIVTQPSAPMSHTLPVDAG